jgi:hypothetical protein
VFACVWCVWFEHVDCHQAVAPLKPTHRLVLVKNINLFHSLHACWRKRVLDA